MSATQRDAITSLMKHFDGPITPPNGYGNSTAATREGASAPDASSASERRVPRPPTRLSSAADICTEAAQLVGGARAVTHGDKSINFANTAWLWNALLEAKARRQEAVSGHPISTPRLDALDVANMLELFKIARRYSGSHNLDDYVDGAGYAGCAGEIAERLATNSLQSLGTPTSSSTREGS